MGETRQLARRRPGAELLLRLAAARPAMLVEVLGLGGNGTGKRVGRRRNPRYSSS